MSDKRREVVTRAVVSVACRTLRPDSAVIAIMAALDQPADERCETCDHWYGESYWPGWHFCGKTVEGYRCTSCKWWDWEQPAVAERCRYQGECRAHEKWEPPDDARMVLVEGHTYPDSDVQFHKDFGCRAWEAKKAQEGEAHDGDV